MKIPPEENYKRPLDILKECGESSNNALSGAGKGATIDNSALRDYEIAVLQKNKEIENSEELN